MQETPDESRYFRSRRYRKSDEFRERRSLARAILSRFWYVLLPFVGILCANQKFVRPDLRDMTALIAKERKQTGREVDDIKARGNGVRNEFVTVQAEVGALYDPRILEFGEIADSLREICSVYQASIPVTQQHIDSLRTVQADLLNENERLAGLHRRRTASLDSLHAWTAHLQDSITALDGLIAARSEQLDRLRNPIEYRRSDALEAAGASRRDETRPGEGQ